MEFGFEKEEKRDQEIGRAAVIPPFFLRKGCLFVFKVFTRFSEKGSAIFCKNRFYISGENVKNSLIQNIILIFLLNNVKI